MRVISPPGCPIKMVFREKYTVSNSTPEKLNDHSVVQLSHVTVKNNSEPNTKPSHSFSSQDDSADTQCGLLCWRPRALQCLASSLWTFVGFYGFTGLCLAASGFYIRSQMTSVERHFRVSTGKMGVLMAANDIGSVIAVMFVSHFGKFSHIPRLLAAMTFLCGFFISAIALIQPFDPVSLPTLTVSMSGNASKTSNDPYAIIFNNPMLLCIDRPPLLRMMMGEDGEIDFEKIDEMMSSFSNGGQNLDMTKILEMLGNAPGENGMDLAKIMEMMGSFSIDGGGMDMAKLMEMMGSSSNNGSGMDMAKLMEMMGSSSNGGSGMDMAKMMEFIIGDDMGSGMDITAMLSMMGILRNEGGSIHWGFYYTFVLMVIIGILSSPRMPLQLFYIESNVKDKTESGIKIGTLNTAMMFGGPMALLIGFPIGMLPVDLVDTEMSFLDPRWIGAWWIGFAIFGVASMLFSLPVFCLPKRIHLAREAGLKEKRPSMSFEDKGFALKSQGSYDLRERNVHRPSNASQLSRLSVTAKSGVRALKEFFYTTFKIFTKPVVILMLLVTFTMILGVSGTVSFQIKYIENQYDMPAYKISLYLGLGSLGTILFGVFLGGLLTTRLKLGLLGMFRMSLIGNLLALACSISFLFLGCDNHQIVGYNQEIGNVTDIGCQCISQALLVVCGEDGRNYLSPCLAGCEEADGMSFKKCASVGGKGTVVPGFCQNCHLFPPFMALFTLMSMCLMATLTPHMLMTARLVPLRDQPNVTALTSVVFTVGMLVGPIIFGLIYDSTCSLWHPFSEMCVVPDKVALREVFIASDIYIRGAGVILLIIATVLVHCQREKYEQFSTTHTEVADPSLATKHSNQAVSCKVESQGLRDNNKTKSVLDMGARGWRKTLAHMMVDDNVGDGGVLGVSYGRRVSNPFPDIRRVSFDSLVTNFPPGHDCSDISTNFENFDEGHKDSGFGLGKKHLAVLEVDNGYDSVSSKSDDNNAEAHDDEVKTNSDQNGQRSSVSEENIKGMFDVEDL